MGRIRVHIKGWQLQSTLPRITFGLLNFPKDGVRELSDCPWRQEPALRSSGHKRTP